MTPILGLTYFKTFWLIISTRILRRIVTNQRLIDVAQLIFRAVGVAHDRWERLRRISQPSNPGPMIGAWLVAVAVGAYGVGVLLSNIVGILSGSPAAVIEGRLLIGKHVVLIPDTSRSMTDPIRQQTLEYQIERLKASGMTVLERRGVSGFGVSRARPPNSLLFGVEQALQAHQQADTIYAFSDFEVTGNDFWQSDAEGYQHLAKMLRDRRVRFYIGTVKYPPPNELVRIAYESDGGLIQ